MGTCKECRFWEQSWTGAEVGACRREPPRRVTEDNLAVWPETQDDEWCGEFDRRPPQGTEETP